MSLPGPLVDTDLPALIVTSTVFLAGFSSLRLHASVNDKKRRVDEVVSSVTTTPSYASTLTRLGDQVSEAASGSDRSVGRDRLAESVARGDNLALTDRDLQPAAAQFPAGPLRTVDDVAWRTLWAVGGLIALVVMLTLWVGLDTVISSGPADWRPLVSWVIACGVGIIVLTVAVLDYRSIDRDYQQFARALAISGLTPTYWRPVPESPLASAREPDGEAALRRAWSLNRGLLQVPSDALVPYAPWGSPVRASEVLASASSLVPEWSSPWMRQAYVGWRQTMVRCHLHDPVAGNLGPDLRARRIQALVNAHVSTQLNPLDPGCRILLAALAIDQLVADLHTARATAFAERQQGSGIAADSRAWDALVTPLPLSDTNSREPNADTTRPFRWRISQALRFAREASILVELKWEAVEGRRAAAGRLTGLDGIAAGYQLARGYLLSASNDPDSKLSRRNADSAAKRLDKVLGALDELGEVEHRLATGAIGLPLDGYHFEPMLLCLSEVIEGEAPAPTTRNTQTPKIELDERTEPVWWLRQAEWLESRPDGADLLGHERGTACFADLWATQGSKRPHHEPPPG